MTPFLRIALAGAGLALLAASLLRKKKAGYVPVAGTALLGALSILESDPVLALGALALAASCSLKSTRQDSRNPRPARGQAPTRRAANVLDETAFGGY